MAFEPVKRVIIAVVGGFLSLVVPVPAAWADDAFARITTSSGVLIPGDQPAIPGIANSKDTVQIFGTVVGLELPVTIANGAISVGKASARPVVITKRIDRASPRLLRAAFVGEFFNIDVVWVMDIAGVKKQSVSVRLEGAYVTRIEANATLSRADAANYEDVSLVYRKLIQIVPTIDATGTVTGTTAVCLNVLSQTASPTTSC